MCEFFSRCARYSEVNTEHSFRKRYKNQKTPDLRKGQKRLKQHGLDEKAENALMWHLTVNRTVGRVLWCMLCGLCLPSQQYCGSTALSSLLRSCLRKGERSNKQAFLMRAQPSAKSSFCFGTDSTAISQSLLKPFLLTVV